MTSLSFTIATLLAGNSVPWFGFDGCNVDLGSLNERSEIATKSLRETDNKLDETTRTLLIDSINESQKRVLAAADHPGVGKMQKMEQHNED